MKTESQIAYYTGISHQEQAITCFNAAYEWLDWILEEEPKVREYLPKNSTFWPWWTAQWNAIDKAFLESIEINLDGIIKVGIPLSVNKSQVFSEDHMAEIWRDWHDKMYIAINPELINKSIQQTIINQVKV